MYTIENDIIKVEIESKGAELQSIFNKQNNLEYMWSGDPAFWGKKSPILFPIVGTLKNDTYIYQEKEYHLSRHGFAREMDFDVHQVSNEEITFTLNSSEATLQKYPFPFQFSITYAIKENTLRVQYLVLNAGLEQMFFSVGGHPAFKVPLTDDTRYEDYYLLFNMNEHAGRWPISKEGLIETAPVPLLENSAALPITKELFSKDALVFKNLQSTKVSLKNKNIPHGLDFDFEGFPFLGIWAAKNADFVCIEPWCGIADSVNTNQLLEDKEGIVDLEGGKQCQRSWSVTVY